MAFVDAVNVIDDPDGAKRGTLSQAAVVSVASARTGTSPATRPRRPVNVKRVIIKPLSILIS
jgi:hypothetical protein